MERAVVVYIYHIEIQKYQEGMTFSMNEYNKIG